MQQGVLRRISIVIIAVLLTAAAAYALGTGVSHWINSRTTQEQLFAREIQTRSVLRQMKTLKVGDTLPDFVFETLDEREIKLSDVVGSHSVISIFEPSCQTCLYEIETSQKALKNGGPASSFIFVSEQDISSLAACRDAFKVKSPVLHDFKHATSEVLRIHGYPFNIVVSRDRVIEQLVSGAFSESEYREIVASNKE
jgi:peroxiredoxin